MAKKLILVYFMLFMVSLMGMEAKASDLDLSQDDKKLHMTASYGISVTSYMVYRSLDCTKTEAIIYSTLTTLAIGAAKEASDDRWDPHDMAANSVGTALGLGMVWVIDF